MLKTLALTAVFVLCSFQLDLVAAQTMNRQAESRVRATLVENPSAASGETDRRPVSREASAEARRLYKEGVKYGRAGLFTQAAELFRRSVELKPDYAAYRGMGDAYFDLRRWEEAIQSLQQALALNPRDKEAPGRIDQALLMRQRETGSSEEKSVAPGTKPQPPAPVQVSLNPTPLPAAVSTTEVSANEMALTRIYLAGPGDVLDVRLDVGPNVQSREPGSTASTLFTITPSGLLEHPILTAPLPVAGLTVEEISVRIEDDLKRRGLADNPKVTVEVRDYVSHVILVSGLVKEPGTKILRREAIPLYVVVADAQPLPEAARVSVVRNKSNEVYTIDLTQPAEMNLLVHPGDVITLQGNPTQFIYVSGGVKEPGEKTFRRGLTLTQAIIAAGGLSGKSREARLAREDGKGFLVASRYKLKDIDSGKLADPLVQPGDRITIVD
jgi:protein involved in polysaccharide export with SLBB domain